MISATNLGKRFGTKRIFDRVDLQLDRGEFLLVTGPNGAGKTTFLRILASLDAPSKGTVLLPDRSLIGYLGHEPYVYRELTPQENLRLFATLYHIPSALERISGLLERFALWEVRDERVSTFSRGMRQRLGLCRVLLHRPSVLILDEPFNALDALGARLLDDVLVEYAPVSAVIVATHDPGRVAHLATTTLEFE